MYYVYVLKSLKDNGFYIGFSANLRQRFEEHNSGKSISTKARRPFNIIFYEAFSNKEDAKSREKYLKSGAGREQLRNILKRTLK